MLYVVAMNLDTTKSVASIVLDHSETAPVFQRNRIDFCCKGQLSIADACSERGLDPKWLLGELERAITERNGEPAQDPREMSVQALVAHIIVRHHEYLRKAMPFVVGLMTKVARVHGEHQPSLRDLEKNVLALVSALEPHLLQEEQVLFPALMARDVDSAVVRKELASMHTEHLEVGALLEKIRTLSNEFVPEPWACGSYRALYAELAALESDIHHHVHLENHVLMPRYVS